MNRAQRRAARHAPPAVAAYAEQYRCPDCDADTELDRDSGGVWHLLIHHDDTCPYYRARTQ